MISVTQKQEKEREAYIEYIDEQYNAETANGILLFKCVRYYRCACA